MVLCHTNFEIKAKRVSNRYGVPLEIWLDNNLAFRNVFTYLRAASHLICRKFNELLTYQIVLCLKTFENPIFVPNFHLRVNLQVNIILLTKKFMSSKSLISGDHFHYISCTHISHRSEDIIDFV